MDCWAVLCLFFFTSLMSELHVSVLFENDEVCILKPHMPMFDFGEEERYWFATNEVVSKRFFFFRGKAIHGFQTQE